MLHSLDIQNYRNLKSLQIGSLGRVNLITGKNNTGKSSLLEAVAIYVTKGNFPLIAQLLEDRGEPYKLNGETHLIEARMKALSSLFNNRNIGFEERDVILIKGLHTVSLRLVKYVEDVVQEGERVIKSRRIIQQDTDISEPYQIGFEVKINEKQAYLIPLELKIEMFLFRSENFRFIGARGLDKGINSILFDNVTLTDKEQYVIKALQIIEPLTEGVAFIEDYTEKRNAVIKLSNSQQILPLQSMGDGINRILTIILAMVNADNGYLLIDEFENGLHHSVQEKLWKIIFKLSAELNVQVFATTHSSDCIKGFENVLNTQDDLTAGKLIRLDNKNGVIKQVEFDAKELKIATDQHIEIR